MATVTWIGDFPWWSPADWNTPADWSTGNVPGAGDDVTIGETYVAVLSNAGTVNSVTNAGGVLEVDAGGSLTVAGSFTNSGALTVGDDGDEDASISIGGSLIGGEISINATGTGNGTITANGFSTIAGAPFLIHLNGPQISGFGRLVLLTNVAIFFEPSVE